MSGPKHYMPLYVGDYLADTAHLTAAEHGAYLLLIMHYWRTGGLPNDDVQLSRIARCTAREWSKIRSIVAAFFDAEWKHSRIDAELQKAEQAYERRALAGRIGGKAKAESKQSSSNAKAGLKQPEPEPEPVEAAATREADDRLTMLLIDAAGQAIDQTRYGLQDLTRPKAWLAAGCDLELDVLPAIRRVCRDKPPMSVKGWMYFDGAVMDAKATRTKPLPIGQPQGTAGRPVKQKIYGRSAIDGDDGGSSAEGNRANAAVLDGTEGRGRAEPGISDPRVAGLVQAVVRR